MSKLIIAYGTYNGNNRQWKYTFATEQELQDFLHYNDAVLLGRL